MKIGEVYFYDRTVAKRIMIIRGADNHFDLGRMTNYTKSIYAIYSLLAPSNLGVWNDDSRD